MNNKTNKICRFKKYKWYNLTMNYINYYSSPLGKIILTSDGEYLTGLYFASTKDEKKYQGEYQKI